MKINITMDTDSFNNINEYGDNVSFEECIINEVITSLSDKISTSRHWQESYVINRLIDNILKESDGFIKTRFEDAIESKIKRSNVVSKINKKISDITKEEVITEVINKIDFTSIIKNEVREIMEKKLG